MVALAEASAAVTTGGLYRLNALGTIVLLALLAGIFFLGRRGAALCVLTGVLYMTQAQSVDVFGVNMYALRFLEMAAFLRVYSRREFSLREMNRLDWTLVFLHVFTLTVYLIRAERGSSVVIARTFDVFLCYFSFRGLLRDFDDWKWLLQTLALLLVPYVIFLGIERITQKNVFFLIGATDQAVWERGGRVRCFGSFRHPSLLGSLGACFFPLFVGLAFDTNFRKRAILGALLCLAIVGFSNSGGPLSVLMVATFGWGLWQLRRRMRLVRYGMLAGILGVAVVMKAPIWYLPAKASIITGGAGWHRSYLMDKAYQNLSKWWLAGMPVEETRDWMPYGLAATGGSDITNQFLAFGLHGGLCAIVLFVFLIYRAFSAIGQGLQVLRERGASPNEEAILWAFGVALAGHIVNWLGITYFDQFYALWLLELAGLVTLSRLWLQGSSTADTEVPSVREEDFSMEKNSPSGVTC